MRPIRSHFGPSPEHDILRVQCVLPMFSMAEIRALAEFLEQRMRSRARPRKLRRRRGSALH